MSIVTLRPASNGVVNGWGKQEDCLSPSGTALDFWEVLADDDDTWIQYGVLNETLSVLTSLHSVTAGHQRHRIRVRSTTMNPNSVNTASRIDALMGVSGTDPQLASVTGSTTPKGDCGVGNLISAWGTGGGVAGFATSDRFFYWRVRLTGGGVAYHKEAFIDIDERARPTIAADILDGDGLPIGGGTLSDTSIPTATFGAIDTDGLAVKTWEVALYTLAQTLAPGFSAFTTVPLQDFDGVGTPADFEMSPVPNGDYVAYFRLASSIRANESYMSAVDSVAFEVDFIPPPGPDFVSADITPNPPSIEVCWGVEDGSDWDDPTEVVAEVIRTDCNGTLRIASVVDGLEGCFTDCHFGLNPEPGCESTEECEISYCVRYWGRVDGVVVVTDETCSEGESPGDEIVG